MIQEDKDLLLKDLCARIPYYVKCNYNDIYNKHNGTLMSINNNRVTIDGICKDIADVKPYLFPMSSMTEEQEKELNNYLITDKKIMMGSVKEIDWLYKHHFDVHNLIPYGLAINATGLNIY